MTKSVVFFVTFFSIAVQAQLAGNWVGWGTWKFKGEGEGVRCSPMQMQWSEAKNKIAIEKGYFDCELVALHLDRTEWQIKDGKLFDSENKEVGTYDGKNLTVGFSSGYENTSVIVKLKREANHYDYQEIWYNPNEKVYVIEGRLFTSGN